MLKQTCRYIVLYEKTNIFDFKVRVQFAISVSCIKHKRAGSAIKWRDIVFQDPNFHLLQGAVVKSFETVIRFINPKFHFIYYLHFFLARRNECPESYCRTPGVGVGVRVRVHKNFNLAYNSWTTIGRAFISHMCIPCDKTFPWVPKFLT